MKRDNNIEQELKESQERYRIISELTSDFAYSFLVGEDRNLIYEWSTDAITRTTGYTIEEILQKRLGKGHSPRRP